MLKPPPLLRLISFAAFIIIGPALLLGVVRPFNADESIFMYGGMLINNGKLPYVDLWDHKGPLLYVLNSIALKTQLPNNLGIPLLQSTLLLLACIFPLILKYRTSLSSQTRRRFVLFVSMVSLVLYTSINSFNTTEFWSLPFQIFVYVSLVELLVASTNEATSIFTLQSYYFISFMMGLCLAAIFLLRPNNGFGVLLAIFLSYTIISVKKIKIILVFSTGFLFTVIFTLCFYLPARGEFLTQFVKQFWEYNLDYSSGYSLLQKSYGSVYLLVNFIKLPLLLVLVCVIIIKFQNLKSRAFFSLVLVALLDFLGQMTSGRGYSSYLVAIFGALFVILYFLINFAKMSLKDYQILCILLTITILPQISTTDLDLRWHQNFREQRIASDYLSKNSSKDEEVIYLGNNPYILVRSERFSASPIVYNYPVLSKFYREQSYLVERLNLDLIMGKPKYIVQDRSSSCSFFDSQCYSGDSQYLQENLVLSEFRQYVLENYQLEAVVGGLNFFRLTR